MLRNHFKCLAPFVWHPRKRGFSEYFILSLCTVTLLPSLAKGGPWSYWGGVSEEILEVPENSVLAGYGVYFPPFTPRARRSSGSLDPLKIQVFALSGSRRDIIALVGIDAIGLRFSTVEAIREAIQTWNPDVRILMNASHSHATPDSFGLWGELPNRSGADPSHLEQIETKAIKAIRAAVSGMRPVILSTSEGTLNTWNSAEEKLDGNPLTWLWMEDSSRNELLGSWTHWNAHPTVLPAENTLVSSDYVGFYRAHLSETMGFAGIHSFANGFLAAEYPYTPAGVEAPSPFEHPDLPEPVKRGIRTASGLGLSLAEHARAAFDRRAEIRDWSVFAAPFTTNITVTNSLFRLAMRLGMVEGDLNSGRLTTTSQWAKIGPYHIVALPGEPSRSVARSFTNIMREAGVEKPLVLGQSGGMIGYLLDPETEWPDEAWRYQRALSTSRATPLQLKERFAEIFWWTGSF